MGTINSIYIGGLAAVISLLIGVTIGAISAFKGGIVDEILMLITNIVILLPSILLMMLIAAFLKFRTPILISLIIGVTSWPWVARAVRSQALSIKASDFIYMSRIAALSDFKNHRGGHSSQYGLVYLHGVRTSNVWGNVIRGGAKHDRIGANEGDLAG